MDTKQSAEELVLANRNLELIREIFNEIVHSAFTEISPYKASGIKQKLAKMIFFVYPYIEALLKLKPVLGKLGNY